LRPARPDDLPLSFAFLASVEPSWGTGEAVGKPTEEDLAELNDLGQ
jgi:hypothetical protein